MVENYSKLFFSFYFVGAFRSVSSKHSTATDLFVETKKPSNRSERTRHFAVRAVLIKHNLNLHFSPQGILSIERIQSLPTTAETVKKYAESYHVLGMFCCQIMSKYFLVCRVCYLER